MRLLKGLRLQGSNGWVNPCRLMSQRVCLRLFSPKVSKSVVISPDVELPLEGFMEFACLRNAWACPAGFG